MHKEFRTSDIVLAAFLRNSGCLLVNIEKVGLKGTFVFTNVNDELIHQYDFGSARVEPLSFNNTIKQLTTSVRRID